MDKWINGMDLESHKEIGKETKYIYICFFFGLSSLFQGRERESEWFGNFSVFVLSP